MILRYALIFCALAGTLSSEAQSKGNRPEADRSHVRQTRNTALPANGAERGGIAGDDCDAAITITAIATGDCATMATMGDNSLATNSLSAEPVCDEGSEDGYQDVWYTFNSVDNEIMLITLEAGKDMTDYAFTVLTACDGEEIACEIGPDPLIEVMVTPNTDYYLRVYSNLDWGVGGSFNLCVMDGGLMPEAPENDECVAAISLVPDEECMAVYTTSTGATESMPAVVCAGFTSPNANDVWFSFVATEVAHTVVVEGLEDFDAVVELFSGDCGDMTSMGCADATFPTEDPATEELVQQGLTVGATYYVRVYDYGHFSDAHEFGICVTGAVVVEGPENDDCAGAIMLEVGIACVPLNATVEGATEEMAAIECNGFTSSTATEVWFAFEATASVHTVMVQGMEDFDAIMELFSGTCDALVSLACADDTFPQGDGIPVDEELVYTDFTIGEMYYVRVYDYGNFAETRDFGICVMGEGGTSVSDLDRNAFNVFPNPTEGTITITGADVNGSVSIELIDMMGRVVHSTSTPMAQDVNTTLSLEGKLASGTYHVSITTENGRVVRPVIIR